MPPAAFVTLVRKSSAAVFLTNMNKSAKKPLKKPLKSLSSLQAYEHLVCQLQQALPGFLLLNGNKLTATSECGWSAVGLLQRQGLPHHPLVLAVLENPRLADLAARLLEVPLPPAHLLLTCNPTLLNHQEW